MKEQIELTIELLEEVVCWHSDKASIDYNECDVDPCLWCSQAKDSIKFLESLPSQ